MFQIKLSKMVHIPFLQQNSWFSKESKINNFLCKYDKFIFISPHLDDAVLSCSNLLEKLKNFKKDVLVITVFTKCTKTPPTPQAQNFINICRHGSGLKLFKDRVFEDINALKIFGARHIHLGFVDAAWRVDKKNSPIYKTSAIQFSGKISVKDNNLIHNVGEVLKRHLKDDATVALAPLGVGNHADHLIINKIIKKIRIDTLFWEDFPYNQNKRNIREIIKPQKVNCLFTVKGSKSTLKEKATNEYSSQIESIFPNGKIPHINENYYGKKN